MDHLLQALVEACYRFIAADRFDMRHQTAPVAAAQGIAGGRRGSGRRSAQIATDLLTPVRLCPARSRCRRVVGMAHGAT